MICPECRERMKFVAYRRKEVTSLMGPVVYERAYYHGCCCGSGHAPTDAELGLPEKLTPAATEVIALHGNLSSFDEAAQKVLPKSANLNVAASTVKRVTEGVGADLSRRREAGETFGDSRPWDWERDAAGDRCAYVSIDATGVAQQAPDHSATEGRLPWVGEIFNPTPPRQRKRGRVWDARYLAGLMPLRELGRQLRREALSVGIEQADVLIGLTDGGNGLEDCLLEEVFSGLGKQMEFILDFYHAAEHVHEFAQALHADADAAKEQAKQWCHTLKHSGGETLLQELQELDVEQRSETVREKHRLLCNYLRNNLHRTDYPRYVRRGWQIGSGTIESACKNVINHRLNGTGMRWSEHGTNELAHVRALHKSEPSAWNAYWSRPPTRKAA